MTPTSPEKNPTMTTPTVDHHVSSWQVGDVVRLQITKHLPFGIVGTLPNGSRGIVRTREITWEEQAHEEWQKRFAPGSNCQVRVLAERADHWELSLRLVEYDPWTQYTNMAMSGHLVCGTVKGFGAQVAFVELINGARALLLEEELPEWIETPIHEALWVGDQIYATIQTVDQSQRTIYLTMARLRERRWPQSSAPTTPTTQPPAEQHLDPLPAIALEQFKPKAHWRPRSVLVIEDDLTQNQAIVFGLCTAGHQAEGVLTGEAALHRLKERVFDTLICDVNLQDQDGIEIVYRVTRQFPEIQCILSTDWMTAHAREEDLLRLNQQSVPLLIKPVLPDEYLTAVAEPKRFVASSPKAEAMAGRRLFTAKKQADNRHSTKRAIFEALRHLRLQSKAEKVVLFQLDVQQRTVRVIAQHGRKQLDSESIAQLIYSPVRDVAEDRYSLLIADVDEVAAYARYLIPLLSFRACHGVPVQAAIGDRYALFQFHHEVGFFNPAMERDLHVTAQLIGTLLERQLFQEQNAELQRTILMGHLARGLIHETNHQMSPILFTLGDLADQCNSVARSISQNSLQTAHYVTEMRESIALLTENMRKLVRTTRIFGRIAVQDREELLRFDQVMDQSIELVRDAANRAQIIIKTSYPHHPVITQLKQTQVQQVIVNLLLNAVQQIERTHRGGGHIIVTLELAHSPDSIDVIRVSVEDDGPGIHYRRWEEIFELGMTTRFNAGSGMGLYIARRLMEDCGGRLYVGSSFLHWGTNMVAEFPIYLPVDGA